MTSPTTSTRPEWNPSSTCSNGSNGMKGLDQTEANFQSLAQHMADHDVHFLDSRGYRRGHYDQSIAQIPHTAGAAARKARRSQSHGPGLAQPLEDVHCSPTSKYPGPRLQGGPDL